MKSYLLLILTLFITTNLYSQFSGGLGTANDPYQITSRADMEALADSVDRIANWSEGKHFKLMHNITDSVRTVVGMIRNAVYEDNARNYTFQGNFNGNNKKITLALDGKWILNNSNQWYFVGRDYVGLFAGIYEANVYDLTIDGYVKGDVGVGGICGFVYSGSVSNCQNKCNITANKGYVGGIYGESLKEEFDGAMTILNCINYGNIYCEKDGAGGIGGWSINYFGSTVISGCTNYGTIYVANYAFAAMNRVKYSDAGGILGCVAGIDSLVNCVNQGDVIANWACVGGIVGRFVGQEPTANYISGCTNYGNINGSQWVGGICGGFSGIDNNRFGTVFNCINHGNITGSDMYAGGITGIAGRDIIMSNCRNTGDIKGYKAVGGILGCLFYGNTTEHFSYSYLINSGNVSGGRGVGGISGHLHYGDTLSYCLNIGTVQGDSIVGGVIGGSDDDNRFYDSTGTINNCHNAGLVIGNKIVGGIQGRCWGEIHNTLNTGVVIGNTNAGGITGEVNKTAVIQNCYYDKQMCIYGGIAGKDVFEQAEGYLTKELIGTNLENKLGSTDWTFNNANLYPTLIYYEGDSVALVASSPVYLYDSDIMDFDRQNRVSEDFKVNLENDVKWNRIVGNVDIVNDDGLLRNDGSDTLVASIGNYKKLVPINIQIKTIDVKDTFLLTLHANPEEGGSVTGAGKYVYDTLISISATANPCYQFVNWIDSATGRIFSENATHEFRSPNDNLTLTANFVRDSFDLALAVNPANAGKASGGGRFACGDDTYHTIEAVASDACFAFKNWTDEDGNVVSENAKDSVIVARNTVLTANFSNLCDIHFTIWATEYKQIAPTETNYSIPIYVKADAKTLQEIVIKRMTVEIDKNIFYLKQVGDNTTWNRNQNEIVIENITIPPLNAGKEVVLFNLIGDVLLGNIDSSEIIINPNVEFAEELNTEPELKNGHITLNICREGSDRLIEIAGNSPSIIIKNNPVNDILEVECNVVEKGKYMLEVVDMTGRSVKVEEFVANNTKENQFYFALPTDNLGAGNYLLVLNTPTGKYSAVFVLER